MVLEAGTMDITIQGYKVCPSKVTVEDDLLGSGRHCTHHPLSCISLGAKMWSTDQLQGKGIQEINFSNDKMKMKWTNLMSIGI